MYILFNLNSVYANAFVNVCQGQQILSSCKGTNCFCALKKTFLRMNLIHDAIKDPPSLLMQLVPSPSYQYYSSSSFLTLSNPYKYRDERLFLEYRCILYPEISTLALNKCSKNIKSQKQMSVMKGKDEFCSLVYCLASTRRFTGWCDFDCLQNLRA